MSVYDDIFGKAQEEAEKNKRHQQAMDFLYGGEQSAPPDPNYPRQQPTGIKSLGTAMFTPQSNTNAAMHGVINQLNRNTWADWQNDPSYRRELGLQMINAQRGMKGYNEAEANVFERAAHDQQEHYLEQMRKMEGIFQQRQQARDAFGSKANYDAYMGLGTSWEDAQRRGLTRKQWADEIEGGYQQAYADINSLTEAERAFEDYEKEAQQRIDYYRNELAAHPDSPDAAWMREQLAANEQELEQRRQELELKRQEMSGAYDDFRRYGFQRQFSSELEYDDLKENEDWESGVAAGRAAADPFIAAQVAAAEERDVGDPNEKIHTDEYHEVGRLPENTWTEEERNIFYYLYNRDPEEAFRYAEKTNDRYDLQNYYKTFSEGQQWAYDHPVLGDLLGLGSRVATLPLGIYNYLKDASQYVRTGRIRHHSYADPRDLANAWTAGSAQRLNEIYTLPEDWAVIGGKGLGDAYQLGASVLESMAYGGLGKRLLDAGAAKWLPALITNVGFFGTAGSEATQQALERGAPSGKALLLGTSAGFAEGLFETISIEGWVHLSRPGTWRAAVVNMLKQGGVEASEEFNTTIANRLFDNWIMGGESEFNRQVQQNILNGMSQREAEEAAWHDWADGLLYDALGGFLSGGVSGGFNQGGQVISGSRTEYSGTDRQALLDAALQMDPKGKAYQLAQKIQQQGTMSYNEALQLKDLMGERAELVSREVSDRERADIQQRAETALKASGVENPGAAAQLIAKEVMGEELTRDERRVLKGVQQAEKVSTALQEQVRQETNFRRYQAQLMRQDVKKQNAAKKKGADTRTTTVKGEKGAVKIEELTVENGRTMAKVTGTDGKSRTVAFSSLELDDYQSRALNTFRQVLGRDAIAAYNSLGSENIYSMSAYDIMQQAIAWGNIRNMFGAKTTDAAKSLQAALASPLRGKLSDAQVTQAFEIGRKNAAEEKTERPHSRRGTGQVSLDGGNVDGLELKGVKNKDQVKRSKEYRAVKAIAKALGIDVVLFESEAVNEAGDLGGIQGAYQDGVIYLDWNAGMKNLKQVGSRMLLRTMSHELTHFIQQNAQELYEELKDYVTGYLADKMGADFNDLVAQKMNGRNVDRDGAIDEVVADACETMLRDSQAVKDLVQNHRSLWQSIKDFVLKYLGNITAEDTGAIYMQDAIQELQEIWGRGLKAAVENRTDAETGTGKAQASTRQTAEQVEAEAEEMSDVHTQYSIRQGPPPKKTMIGYKVFMADKKHPGQLYPTKVKNPGGQGTPVGVWLNADTGEIARNPDGSIKTNTRGRISVKANGGTLAWRPGWHLGSLPEANQMNRVDPNNPESDNSNRGTTGLMWDNYIFCECEFAADEDYQLEAFEFGTDEKGRYNHSQAGLPYIPKDGYYKYRTNPDPSTAPWFISGSIRITKILDDDMRREIIEKWNAEHPDQQMRFTERYSGKPINLADYGLKAGPVAATEDLSSVASGVDYSDEIRNLPGYTRHALNFDDPNVQEAFRIQQIEDRRNYYIDKYNREHRDELENGSKKAATTGGVQYNLRSIDIDRNYIAHGDVAAEDAAVKATVNSLIAREKFVNISAKDAAEFNDIDYNNFRAARKAFGRILERFLGVTVKVTHKGQVAEAYLTRSGLNHAVVTEYTPGKAAVYKKLCKMITNAEYSYSSADEPHITDAPQGNVDWDAFVSVARFGKYIFPTVIKFRSIDRDVRSQIYNIASKREEIGSSHSPGLTNQGGLPNYGGTPISSNTITDESEKSNTSAQTSVRGEYKGVEEAAIQHFGTTDNFRTAGYILQDGKMLDFSGAHWLEGYDDKYIADWRRKNDIRQVDHEDVYEAFEQISDDPPSDAALAFINGGNIRIVPEVPGLELSGTTEPTAAQYRQIKDFVREIASDPKHYNSEYFSIDITKDRTHKVGALKYEGNINADRVINDIKHYYQTGEIREQGLGAFYSVRDTSAKTDRELLAGVTAQTVMSERLQQENEILRESVRDLRKLLGQRDGALDKLRRQLRLTKSPELRLNDAKRMTRSLLQDYDSRADAARIAQEVKELGEFILGTELTGEAYDQELDRRLGSIARQVVENAKAEFTEGTDVYKEIASRIKGKKISVDAGNLGDLGDFGAFRKSLFGKLIVSQRAANTRESREDYTSADQMYAELQADYGETIFPTALNEGEELQNIARALELAKPTEANPFAQDMQAAEESVRNRVLMDLYSGALELEAPTAADRAKSRRKALQDQIKQLQRENRLSEKESQRMAEQIYALDTALDNARSQYETLLRENAERRNELEKYRKQLDRYEQKEREVSQALDELDALVKEGTDADAVNKQRARLSDKERQMTEALQAVTKAQQSPALQQILQRERAIERTRTRERIREGVNRRDLRQRVERLWKDMNRRITSPTEKKHIPVSVMQQAIEVLQALNMDTSREGTKSGEKLRAKLTELKARYEALQKDPDYRQAAMYDEQVAEYLASMIETVGDTPINKMSVAQLESVLRTLTALDYVARHALKLKLGEEERSAYEVSQAMTRETRSVPKAKTGLAAAWLNAQLSAERMFRRLGGYHKNSTWEQVYRMLNDGQLRQTQIQMEGSMIFADLLAAKDYGKFVDPGSTVDIGLKDEDGNPVKITHGMMVSLWMHLQNEQNRRHVAFGGLTIPGLKDYYNGKKVKGSERAIRIGGALQELAEINDKLQALEESDSASADEIAELEAKRDEVSLKAIEYVESLQESIEKQLTDYDRQWIAACRELFDGLSKRVLNQTTLEVYGIKRANVENYFPIWVDGDFLNTPFETVAKDLSLENAGFMKERVDSSKPIRLADVSDVAASQIRKVSQYAGLMPAIRNFGKIWGKTQTGYRDSLRKAVHETFGQNGVNYIEHLIADLNGARSKENDAMTEFFNRMRGHMAQASLTLSLRVAMGQTASYPTAAAVVGWKALHKALWRGGRNNWALSRADKELIQKYSPLLYYRMQGYRDPELGNIAGMNDKWSRVWKKARWLTGWIQAMDGATVGRLWYAAEYYVQDHNKDLQKGTDAYYEAVAKVFNDIVERTQPNYSIMQRPDILRNPSSLIKQLTMFLTQRLQNFNILYDAAATSHVMYQDYKAGRNGVTMEDVRQARMETRRAALSQVVAGITITVFKTLADIVLHSLNAYRDDDDKELKAESIAWELLDMFIDSMSGNILLGSELWDIAESMIPVFNKTYYGIEISGIAVVQDMIDASMKLATKIAKGEATGKDYENVIRQFCTVLGIPYANGKKFFNAGKYWIQDAVNGEWLWESEAGVDRTTAMQAHRLYRAYQDKDFGKVNKIRGQFPEDKQKDLDKAVREYIKDQYKAGDITVYEAMRQLQSYGNASPTTMADFIKDEYKAGNLQKGDAVKYLVEYAGRSQESAEKTVRELSAERDTGVKYSEINDQYLMGEISGQQATQMLVDYGGKDPETAALMVEFWDFQNKHPGSEMEFSQYQTYTNKYKPIGLSPEQYEDYARRMKDCKGVDADGDGKTDSGSKKIEVVALIDSMDLTPAQKDQMYLANNYAESGLKDCPWNK